MQTSYEMLSLNKDVLVPVSITTTAGGTSACTGTAVVPSTVIDISSVSNFFMC